MKIRTKIKLWLLLTALLIPASVFLAMMTTHNLQRQMDSMAATDRFINSLAQLRMVAVETTLYHDARSSEQWQLKRKALEAELARFPAYNELEKATIQRFYSRLALAESMFVRLDASSGKSHDDELIARAVTSLFALTQEMTDVAYDLIEGNQAHVKQALHVMQVSIALMILMLAGLMLFIWRLIHQSVLAPLKKFEEATYKVAAGDYSWQLSLPQNDEIGVLARAFDSMTANVQDTREELMVEAENSRRAEVALFESAGLTKAILDHAADGILTMNKFGIIQSANLALKTIFGYEPETLVGNNIACLMPESYQNQQQFFFKTHQEANIANPIGMGQTLQGLRKNGESFPMEWVVSHVQYRGEDLFVGLVRDISERQRIEQMKGEFVSTVSHELRTPLTSISGALGLLMGGAMGAVPPMMQRVLDIAHKNAQRLARLIDDLLDMEKLEAEKFSFDLCQQALMPLIDQALENSAAYGERLQVSFQVLARLDEVQVRVDAHRLQQVMANFLSNAAKFSPSPGQVVVQVSQAGEWVRVAVIDHGEGIPLAFQARIFQKFSQADSSDTRSKGGTGLGLAISRELIERMGGRIGFESTPGVGTCFYFELAVVGAVSALS